MARRRGRPAVLLDDEVALAMELRVWGCTWKVIAEGLGIRADTLNKRVKSAEREGMKHVSR